MIPRRSIPPADVAALESRVAELEARQRVTEPACPDGSRKWFSYRYGNTSGNCHQGTVPPRIPNHPMTQRILPPFLNSTAIRA